MVTRHEQVVAEREGTIGEAIVFTLERVQTTCASRP